MARIKTWVRYDNKKVPLTEEEITDIVEKKYCDCLPYTKKYIANGLRTIGPKFKARICIMVKQDFINEFNKLEDVKGLNFSFEKVPEVISNITERFSVTCKETICGVEIGEIEVTRELLFGGRYNPKLLGYLTKYIRKEYKEDKILTKTCVPELIEELGESFDFSESKVVNEDVPIKLTCKTCGKVYWKRLSDFKYRVFNACSKCKANKEKKDRVNKAGINWLKSAKEKHSEHCDYTNAQFHGNKKPVTGLVCKNCGNEFSQFPDAHLNSIYGFCPDCCKKFAGAKSRSNLENVKEITERRYGVGKFDWSKAKYETGETPIILIDIETGIEFEIPPKRLISGVGLPITHKNSMGETNVQTWLAKNLKDSIWKPQQVHREVEGRRGTTYVRIDFEFFEILGQEKHVWLECHGQQHYEYNSFFAPGEKDSEESIEYFRDQLRRDENIRKHCKENGILYIELPYTYYDLDKMSEVLERILIRNENPEDVIDLPEIKEYNRYDTV